MKKDGDNLNNQMYFTTAKCPKCGKLKPLMFSNNPLTGGTICFDCIRANLNYQNAEHADFFCRTYNLNFNPDLWINLAEEFGDRVFEQYTIAVLTDTTYSHNGKKENLFYQSSTQDIWSKVNKEWEKMRSLSEILGKIPRIKESYIERGCLKWGDQYTFEELIYLDTMYSRTLKSNNITNPMQKEAVKTLCKIQVEMNEAIKAKDAKAIKDFSTAWSTFAKQADLETMINQTKTDDITTVAELYQYMEDNGFEFKFHDGFDRDEVDMAITDIQNANRRLILEATGLETLLEDMINQKQRTIEETFAKQQVSEDITLKDLIDFSPADLQADISVETDEEALDMEFDAEDDKDDSTTIILK